MTIRRTQKRPQKQADRATSELERATWLRMAQEWLGLLGTRPPHRRRRGREVRPPQSTGLRILRSDGLPALLSRSAGYTPQNEAANQKLALFAVFLVWSVKIIAAWV